MSTTLSDLTDGAATEPLLDTALLIRREDGTGVLTSGVGAGESLGPSASSLLFRFRDLMLLADLGASVSNAARTEISVSKFLMVSSGSSLRIFSSSSASLRPSRYVFSTSSSLATDSDSEPRD